MAEGMDAVQLRRFCIAGRRKHDRRAFYAAAAVKIQRSCRSMEDDVNIQKNQIFTVKITDMGTDGEGIGHLEDSDALSGNGYTLFVKDAVLGDTVRAKVVKPKKGYAFARLEEVLEPSPDRVEPVCAYARQCGGCQLQAVSYEKQLAFK